MDADCGEAKSIDSTLSSGAGRLRLNSTRTLFDKATVIETFTYVRYAYDNSGRVAILVILCLWGFRMFRRLDAVETLDCRIRYISNVKSLRIHHGLRNALPARIPHRPTNLARALTPVRRKLNSSSHALASGCPFTTTGSNRHLCAAPIASPAR